MAKVAFIGLGRMGHGMAGRYLDAGFTVAVWNRSKAKAEDLIARGARWATSPEDAAIDADAVVTMVADDEASRAVWLTKDGAAATMKAGTLAIECSTVSYRHALEMARELRGRGLVYIDSPVTGLPDAAAAGKLTLLVGADAGRSRAGAALSDPAVHHHPAFRRGRHRHGLQADQQSDGRDPDRGNRRGPRDRRAGRSRHEAGAGGGGDRRRPPVRRCIRHSKRMVERNFSGATFTAALRHKDAAYAVALAESLLAEAPSMGRAAVQAYDRAKANAPDDDEGKMIEIVSRPRDGKTK